MHWHIHLFRTVQLPTSSVCSTLYGHVSWGGKCSIASAC